MKVERIEKAEPAKAPADVKLRLELKQARATIRALRREVKAERAWTAAMLKSMRRMAELASEGAAAAFERCTCVPARSDALRR